MKYQPLPLSIDVLADVASTNAPAAWLTTLSPILVVAIGGIIAGLYAAHNRRKGATESRFPDVNEIWSQQAKQSIELDNERKFRRALEDYANNLLRAFRSYVRRALNGGDLRLSDEEKNLIDGNPPTASQHNVPQS